MRLSTPACVLVSAAALSFSAAAAAKAPRPRAAAAAPVVTAPSTPPADEKGPADAEAPAGAPAGSSAAPTAPAPSGAQETVAPSSEPPASPTSEGGTPPVEEAGPRKPEGPPVGPLAPVKHAARPEAPSDEPEVIAPARDTVGGHFVVGVDAALVVPFGNIRGGVPQSRTMGPGLSLGGDVAYGISRTVMLGAYIDVGLPSAEGTSSKNSIATIAAGPLIRYHLVQGLAFDPWMSAGFGFRRTSDGSTSFAGVDWVRLAIGGDWYPAANFGFGPFVDLSLGTFFAQSPGSIGAKGVDAHFVIGGRIVFDGPGR